MYVGHPDFDEHDDTAVEVWWVGAGEDVGCTSVNPAWSPWCRGG